jgi:hypothetical protein
VLGSPPGDRIALLPLVHAAAGFDASGQRFSPDPKPMIGRQETIPLEHPAGALVESGSANTFR